jgi:hypothetical protein
MMSFVIISSVNSATQSKNMKNGGKISNDRFSAGQNKYENQWFLWMRHGLH